MYQTTVNVTAQKKQQSFILQVNLQFGQGLSGKTCLCSMWPQLDGGLENFLPKWLTRMADKLGAQLGLRAWGLGSFPGLSIWPGLSHKFWAGGDCKNECSKSEPGRSCIIFEALGLELM